MPFRPSVFREQIAEQVSGAVRAELDQVCNNYQQEKTLFQKTRAVRNIMMILDRALSEETRYAIMEACGCQCIGMSTLIKAKKLSQHAATLDELVKLLNENHFGGGYLERRGEAVYGAYTRFYCGSVNKTRELFSETYCHCSCGWYKQLFETLVDRLVLIELLGLIIQGDDRCEFMISW